VKSDHARKQVTVQGLYPELSEDQLKEVEETLHNYAAIVWRVCERLEREQSGTFDDHKVSS
jgi:hypothetical protein